MTTISNQSTDIDKTTAIIAYITLIGLIIAYVQNKDKKNAFVAYHIRQSLGLICTSFALSIINIVPILGWIVSSLGFVLLLVLWILGLMNALNGQEKPVMILGEHFNKWFKEV